MTEAPMSYADFEQMVHDGLADFETNLNAGIDSVQKKFNEKINEIPDWEWLAKPWLVITVNRGVDALQEKFGELVDAFEEEAPKILEKIGEIEGDPITLTLLSNGYINAGRVLTDIGETYLPDAIGKVSSAWSEGEGPEAFGRQAPKQAVAASGAAGGMGSAADALGQASSKIIQSWLDVHAALVGYAGDIVDSIEQAASGAQIITLEVGPAIKVVLAIFVKIAELANTLIRYVADDVTAGATAWKALESGNSIAGLMAGNTWPKIGGVDGRDMTNQSKW